MVYATRDLLVEYFSDISLKHLQSIYTFSCICCKTI